MNALFVYRNNQTGIIKVAEIDEARMLEFAFEHIASIEPRDFLEAMLNKEPEIVDRWFK